MNKSIELEEAEHDRFIWGALDLIFFAGICTILSLWFYVVLRAPAWYHIISLLMWLYGILARIHGKYQERVDRLKESKMLRLFLEDTQVDLENTMVKEFTELVHNFARRAVEHAVEYGLDLSDAETMWHQAIQVDILEASLKLTFKRLREERLKNE